MGTTWDVHEGCEPWVLEPDLLPRSRSRRNLALSTPQLIACPNCGTEVQLPAAARRTEWHCPECGNEISGGSEPTDVPDSDSDDESTTYQIVREPKVGKPTEKPDLTYLPTPVAEPEEQPAARVSREPRHRESIKVKVDPPPVRPFVSGVFGFPFQGSVVGQWLVLTCCFSFFALLALVMVSLYQAAASLISGIGAFIVLPAFWIGLWTFSYAAACSLIVVEETAAGNNEIRDWMEGGWKEWVWDLFYVGYVAALPMAFAWPIVKLAGRTYADAAIPLAIVEFVLFPIFLLSALEQDSPWFPMSPPILSSLFKAMGGWFAFYCMSALVAAACGGLVYFAVGNVSFGLAFVIGPTFAAAMLIYARLLGRLGWVILDRVPNTRHERPKKERPIPDELD